MWWCYGKGVWYGGVVRGCSGTSKGVGVAGEATHRGEAAHLAIVTLPIVTLAIVSIATVSIAPVGLAHHGEVKHEPVGVAVGGAEAEELLELAHLIWQV